MYCVLSRSGLLAPAFTRGLRGVSTLLLLCPITITLTPPPQPPGKTFLTTYLGGERGDTSVHVGASLIAGLVSTTVAAPFDVLKTRGMHATTFVSPRKLLVDAVRTEGPGVLMRGWVPAYCRLGPHAMICFPIMEQMRKLLGMDAI